LEGLAGGKLLGANYYFFDERPDSQRGKVGLYGSARYVSTRFGIKIFQKGKQCCVDSLAVNSGTLLSCWNSIWCDVTKVVSNLLIK
jgi:hypothetical protein